MRKTIGIVAMTFALFAALAFAGCSSSAASGSSAASSSAAASASAQAAASSASASAASASAQAPSLAPGKYTVDFKTDSSMFHANEADKGKGVLTVTDKDMTLHVRLVSKKITNLYVGTAEQAKSDEAHVLNPTVESVTYEDGTSEEVNAFDVPVAAIDEEFDLAILGESGKWFDHKVSVSNPVAQ